MTEATTDIMRVNGMRGFTHVLGWVPALGLLYDEGYQISRIGKFFSPENVSLLGYIRRSPTLMFVHFFHEDGTEVGYYSDTFGTIHIFHEKRRVWGEEALSTLQMLSVSQEESA